MFKKVFSIFTKEKEVLPEQRRLPRFVQDAKEGEWVTSQVFIDNNNTDIRVYYAATRVESHVSEEVKRSSMVWDESAPRWIIEEYRWNVRDKLAVDPATGLCDIKPSVLMFAIRAEDALQQIATYEKNAAAVESGLTAVPELKGNYRQVVSCYGGHFDGKGNYMTIDPAKPVAETLTFNNQSLKRLYTKKAAPAENKMTWERLYAEIVNKQPASEKTVDKGTERIWIRRCESYLATIKKFPDLLEKDISSKPARDAILSTIMFMTRPEERAEMPEAFHHLNAAALVTLLRLGRLVTKRMTADVSGKDLERLVGALEGVTNSIHFVCEMRLGLSTNDAAKIANLLMQGDDPYADQPLPLETWLKAMTPAPEKAPQKPQPPC